jgi:hypothetical protein
MVYPSPAAQAASLAMSGAAYSSSLSARQGASLILVLPGFREYQASATSKR